MMDPCDEACWDFKQTPGSEEEIRRLFDGSYGQPLATRIGMVHRLITAEKDSRSITRIGIATYDPASDLLKTFVASDLAGPGLGSREAKLSSLPGLKALADSRSTRIIDDLANHHAVNGGEIINRLVRTGMRSSLTLPIHVEHQLIGFCFLDSQEVGAFSPSVVVRLWPFIQLLSFLLVKEYEVMTTMRAALKSAQALLDYKDTETAIHLDRMAHVSRLIAHELADANPSLSDEYVEHVFRSASFHDVGKLAIPDAILLKPEKLSKEEFAIMQTHVARGLEIMDIMVRNFSFAETSQIKIVRNVVGCHHECLDGSGYPRGLKGEEIPLEGRIVAVADVFDALIGERPYKARWSKADAMTYLEANAGTRFDAACVQALRRRIDSIPDARSAT